ncbi:HAMP domain-containing protein, partial [Belnapia moabensis]|uniref:HAMP domain-containing protein n=1 Tax=Belnapia moabensis TaxID=365533 RepID=UPI0012ED1613
MLNFLQRSLSVRIYLIFSLLAVSALVAAIASSYMLRNNTFESVEAFRAANAARAGERVNAHVLAVVAESRGIYMAKTAAEAQRFAAALRSRLEQLQRDVAQWKVLVPAEQRPAFAKLEETVADFVRFRTETARLGVEVGAAAADAQGNNEQNRANRQALNNAISENSKAAAELADQLSAEVYASGQRQTILIVVFVLPLVLICGIAAVITVRRSVLTPMAQATDRLTAMATGDLASAVPGAERRDELGRIAAAMMQLRDSLSQAVQLQAEQARLQEVQVQRAARLEALTRGFEGAVGQLSSTLA